SYSVKVVPVGSENAVVDEDFTLEQDIYDFAPDDMEKEVRVSFLKKDESVGTLSLKLENADPESDVWISGVVGIYPLISSPVQWSGPEWHPDISEGYFTAKIIRNPNAPQASYS